MFLGFHLELKFAQQVFSKTNGYFDRKETSLISQALVLEQYFTMAYLGSSEIEFQSCQKLFILHRDIEDRIFRNSKETFVSLEIDNFAQVEVEVHSDEKRARRPPSQKNECLSGLIFILYYHVPSSKCDITVCVFQKYSSIHSISQ